MIAVLLVKQKVYSSKQGAGLEGLFLPISRQERFVPLPKTTTMDNHRVDSQSERHEAPVSGLQELNIGAYHSFVYHFS